MTLELRMNKSRIVVFELPPHSSDDLHHHDEHYQISIPLQSQGHFQHNNTVRNVSSQQRLVLTPGSAHRHIAGDEPLRVLLIAVNEHLLHDVYHDVNGTTPTPSQKIEFHPWSDHSSQRFIQLVNIAVQQQLDAHMTSPLALSEIEAEMAHHLLQHQDGSHHMKAVKPKLSTDVDPVLRLIIDYIYEHLSADLSLDALARAGNVSKYHLIDLFKAYTGLTPSRYIRETRMKEAANLLKHSKLTVTDIAYQVGFTSLSTFNRVFKQKYALSPTRFRNEL